MSFSGLGPHIWVPRRSGLGAVVPGGYVIPPDAGQIKASLQSTAVNYASSVSASAQGYLTQEASASARSSFTSATGVTVPWVPTDPKQVGPWAQQMVQVYSSPMMTAGIEAGKRTLQDFNIPENPSGFGPPFTEDEASQWATGYLASHPDMLTRPSAQGAVAMMQAFVSAQGAAIGLPPEFIAAAQLAHGFPTDVASAEKWGLTLGSAYLSQYGVPIVSDASVTGFLQASGRFGMAQVAPGVPFGLCEATFSALSNGSINYGEAQGLVVGACAFVGGAVGQAFGIPAPLGALLGQLVGSVLTGPVADALGFGPSDSEKLNAAQEAATKAAAAATVVCTDLARALWLEYQQYWDSVQTNLQGVIRANQEWLFAGSCDPKSGVMVFPESVPGENTLDYILDANGAPVMGKNGPLRYPYPTTRYCGPMTGCTYNSTPIDPIAIRAQYDLTMVDLKQKRIPSISWNTSGFAGCDALGALAFWGARRYVTPYQVMYALHPQNTTELCAPGTSYCLQPAIPNMFVREYVYHGTELGSRNKEMWDGSVHSDEEYLQNIGLVTTAGAAGEQVGDCFTPQWAQFMFLSLQQAPAASALVQRDLARTVSYVTAQYGISKRMDALAGGKWLAAGAATQREAARQAAARAASFRNAVREAQRRGRMKADLLNYGLLAAGGAALAGWATAKRSR
jgi:hypothetical protein